MNDEVKVEGDAKATLEHVDAVINSDALKAKATIVEWGKAHIAALVGVVCLVIGLIVGHLLPK